MPVWQLKTSIIEQQSKLSILNNTLNSLIWQSNMPDKTSMKRSAVLVYDNERCYLDNSSASYLTKTSRNVTLFCTSCQSVISPLRLTTRKIKVLLAAIAWPRINQQCIFFRCSWYRQHSALILPQHNFKLTSTPYCFLIWNNDSLTGGEWP